MKIDRKYGLQYLILIVIGFISCSDDNTNPCGCDVLTGEQVQDTILVTNTIQSSNSSYFYCPDDEVENGIYEAQSHIVNYCSEDSTFLSLDSYNEFHFPEIEEIESVDYNIYQAILKFFYPDESEYIIWWRTEQLIGFYTSIINNPIPLQLEIEYFHQEHVQLEIDSTILAGTGLSFQILSDEENQQILENDPFYWSSFYEIFSESNGTHTFTVVTKTDNEAVVGYGHRMQGEAAYGYLVYLQRGQDGNWQVAFHHLVWVS